MSRRPTLPELSLRDTPPPLPQRLPCFNVNNTSRNNKPPRLPQGPKPIACDRKRYDRGTHTPTDNFSHYFEVTDPHLETNSQPGTPPRSKHVMRQNSLGAFPSKDSIVKTRKPPPSPIIGKRKKPRDLSRGGEELRPAYVIPSYHNTILVIRL